MANGFIKIWRKTLDSEIWQNHKLFKFWMWCLLKATHEIYVQTVGKQEVELLPGQFVFGRKNAALETGLSEQEIRTNKTTLQLTNNITSKPTNKFSIITIVNWNTYQSKETKNNQQIHPPVNQQNNQHLNHKQEVKKKERQNKKHSDDSNPIIYSKKLFEKIKIRDPKYKLPNFQAWAGDLDKLNRIDGRKWDVIDKAIVWSQKDTFWQTNILSAFKLRKQFPTLVQQMKKDGIEVDESPRREVFTNIDVNEKR